MCVFCETRVKKENSKKVCEKICRGWECVDNYDFAYNGRLWIVWNAKKVGFVQASDQHCHVLDMSLGYSFDLIAVYGHNSIELRKELPFSCSVRISFPATPRRLAFLFLCLACYLFLDARNRLLRILLIEREKERTPGSRPGTAAPFLLSWVGKSGIRRFRFENRTRSKHSTVDGKTLPERQPQTKDGQAPVPRVRVFPIMSLLRSELN